MRKSETERKTRETDIRAAIDLDGTGVCSISTGIGFLDHMLTALAVHAGADLTLSCAGDLEVDCHHTAEDVGIVLGRTLKEALATAPNARFGTAFVPMDEALGFCSLDISGRPYLVFDCIFSGEKLGELDCCMVREFFRAVAFNAGLTLHLRALYGDNDHHKCEALFKAFARALRQAGAPAAGPVSTKGALD